MTNELGAETSPYLLQHKDNPAQSMRQLDGQATAYVCLGQTCSLPQAEAAQLRATLAATSKQKA